MEEGISEEFGEKVLIALCLKEQGYILCIWKDHCTKRVTIRNLGIIQLCSSLCQWLGFDVVWAQSASQETPNSLQMYYTTI